ncbi:amino acid racemase [Sphingomonas sp. G124]|uniref:Amino acid racemase n=1 Tax=Sphingomonas cremea TaxID=2904799 RepID=A0A9X1QIG0_9SPHN|nr:amino acid racemase [Sphingomonas cremea]MCF2514348.1 amino acid racemase [Sphingomonas cremea]
MKKLGIVGGASWASTALYYEQINRGIAHRLGGLHSAVLAIESLDFAPLAAMQQAEDWAGVAQGAVEAARRLKASGVEGLLLASNTMHRVGGEIVEETGLPILHIGDAAAERIVSDGRTRVALLGTRFVQTETFIRERYESRGIQLIDLNPMWRTEVDRIIYEELAAGRVVRESQRKLKTLITELGKQKVQAIVLGCTELVLAVDVRANVLPVYDTTAIHARMAVDWMLGEQEQARAAA